MIQQIREILQRYLVRQDTPVGYVNSVMPKPDECSEALSTLFEQKQSELREQLEQLKKENEAYALDRQNNETLLIKIRGLLSDLLKIYVVEGYDEQTNDLKAPMSDIMNVWQRLAEINTEVRERTTPPQQ